MKKYNPTITERFIYSLIDSYTRNEKDFFGSNEYIAKELGRSISVVSHSISNLIKNEYLINEGNKYFRKLKTNNKIGNVDFNISNAENSTSNAENSISYTEIKRLIAENSTNEMLKSAIANAENSNILLSILISYTNIKENNIKEKTKNKYFDNDEVNNIFLDFLKLRKKIKAQNTDRAINLLLKKLGTLTDEEKIEVIDKSIVNSWKDLYLPKQKENKIVPGIELL